jgi:hypothetical protein
VLVIGCHWYNIIVVNVHSPCVDKRDNVKDNFLISFLGTT